LLQNPIVLNSYMDLCVKLEMSSHTVEAYNMMREFEASYVPKKA